MALNNREIATLFWLSALVCWMLSNPDMRRSLMGLLRAFAVPYILGVLAGVSAYIALCVWLLDQVGLWAPDDLKTTMVWAITFAFVTALSVNRIRKEKTFYEKTVRDAVSATAAILYVAEFYTLPLLVELALYPFVALLVGVGHLAKQKPESQSVATFANVILGAIGLSYLANGVWGTVRHADEFWTLETARDFGLPILLTLAFLPAVYILLRYLAIERLVQGMRFALPDPSLRRHAVWQALLHFGGSEDYLNRWRRDLQTARPKTRAEIDAIVTRLLAARTRERTPSLVDPKDGWSPHAARMFLKQEGLPTNDYHESFGEWFAASHMTELGDDPFPNNIAYYIEGTADAALCLRLELNVNARASAQQAEGRLRELARQLTRVAIGIGHDTDIDAFLASNVDGKRDLGGRHISARRETFASGAGRGYHRSFVIKHSASPSCDPVEEAQEHA